MDKDKKPRAGMSQSMQNMEENLVQMKDKRMILVIFGHVVSMVTVWTSEKYLIRAIDCKLAQCNGLSSFQEEGPVD